MSKRHLLIDPAQPSTSKHPKPPCITDWELCAICQVKTKEALQCPARSKQETTGSGYVSLAKDLRDFKEFGQIPGELDMDRLDDGSGIEATLMTNMAKWHKACRVKYNQTMLQRRQKSAEGLQQSESSKVNTRSDHTHTRSSTDPVCFFCNKPAGSEVLHAVLTKQLDINVRTAAVEMQDTELLAKLAPGDMIALEAKYHRNCLRMLYNRARQSASSSEPGEEEQLHGIAFAELVAFMEEAQEGDCAPVFKLVDLSNLYKERLEQLGANVQCRIHSTRLKNRLLCILPNLRAYSQGRDTFLTFEEDIADALKKACDHDNDAMHLVRAAQVVRREMFHTKFIFDGSFHQGCQEKSVPPSLLALVNMILDGTNIKHKTELLEKGTKLAALTVSQLIVFNSVKHTPATKSSHAVRHSRDCETPLPLYLAMKVHAITRKRGLVDTLFHLGMCVSYDRLLQISADIANGVCSRFKVDGLVCPPKMRNGLFTTAAVDNIDHNPSSATAINSFHGTGISLIQHPTHEFAGSDRSVVVIDQSTSSTNSIAQLPQAYSSVPPVAMKKKTFTAPKVNGPVKPPDLKIAKRTGDEEYEWLKAVEKALDNQETTSDWISWSAFHANMQQAVIPPPAINALLPLFLDNAHSAAMIKHAMDIIRAAVHHLNPGQIPVLTVDQPLYALAKEIQWTWPDSHGEDHFVIMFGGLHIEMAVLKVLGDWLADSGWTNALVQAEIASPGTADSFIRASHLTKTRHAHQVTAASLYKLLQQAYREHCKSEAVSSTFEQWCQQRGNESVHFDYWLKTLSLEVLMLVYVRSLREGNFELYVEILAQLLPWMFALDHTHYARWLSVHVRDMMVLSGKHPGILEEFTAGKFVVNKTRNKFSAIAIDHCHEQNNASIKGSGGAVGLTESPGALRRWMLAGPEIARITADFEVTSPSSENHHHEQQKAVQETFKKQVRSLTTSIEEMGNPFLEESSDLLVLDSKEIMDSTIADTVRKVEALGEGQYKTFVEERLEHQTKPVTDTLPKNKLPLFSHPPVKTQSKQKIQLEAMTRDCNLFSRLYVSCQTRDGDLDQFFSHENQAAPPSLSSGGKMRLGTKADLLNCILTATDDFQPVPVVDAVFLDGAAVVQMMNPGTAKSFQDYADSVFLQYVNSQLEQTKRIDIVWDVYIDDSLKSTTRQKRGKGVRMRVLPTTAIPKNWKDFLRVDENKSELFDFLSQQIICLNVEGKEVYATSKNTVLCSPPQSDLTNLTPCSHEEADTRLFLHVSDAARKGCTKVTVRTVDTDVVVIAIAMFRRIELEEMWIAFGTGANFHYIAVHEVTRNLDLSTCCTLPLFHALTGCDTVSSFAGRGKKTAWETWRAFPAVTESFKDLMEMPAVLNEESVSVIERFVVLMYDRTSEIVHVNEARKELFTRKSRTLQNIPPSKAALEQHIRRAIYQANIWNNALSPAPDIPSPCEWGWVKEPTGWQPLWTTLPEASQSCYELIHCGCKKGCTTRCKCRKAALKCTALCSCSGDC